jgi:hypothetical protein
MGKKGIVLDVDVILTPQAVATGGIDTGADFWGNTEYTLNVDTQKAGLWPGGFLKVVGNSAFGDNILGDSGAGVPPPRSVHPLRRSRFRAGMTESGKSSDPDAAPHQSAVARFRSSWVTATLVRRVSSASLRLASMPARYSGVTSPVM